MKRKRKTPHVPWRIDWDTQGERQPSVFFLLYMLIKCWSECLNILSTQRHCSTFQREALQATNLHCGWCERRTWSECLMVCSHLTVLFLYFARAQIEKCFFLFLSHKILWSSGFALRANSYLQTDTPCSILGWGAAVIKINLGTFEPAAFMHCVHIYWSIT